MAEQTERAYQKQPTVFQNSKYSVHGIGKKSGQLNRYVKNVGLGFKTPREVCFLSVTIFAIIAYLIFKTKIYIKFYEFFFFLIHILFFLVWVLTLTIFFLLHF